MNITFGKTIQGVEVSGTTWLKARFAPSQLKQNLIANFVAPALGVHNYRYDLPIKNKVLRSEFYAQAINGDRRAYQYLKAHDPEFGQYQETYADALKEIGAIMSGYYTARQLGRMTLAVTYAGISALSSRPERQSKYAHKAMVADDRYVNDKPVVGKIDRKKSAYDQLKINKKYDPYFDRNDPYYGL
jgi:hypothetical protein